jgi:hypothetical protein
MIVMAAVKRSIATYDLESVWAPRDSFAAEAKRAASLYDLCLREPEDVTPEMHASLRLRFVSDGMEIPPDPDVKQDLLMQRRRVTPSGVAYESARFATLMALLAAKALGGPTERKVRPAYGTTEYWEALAREEEREDYARMAGEADWVADLARDAGYQ